MSYNCSVEDWYLVVWSRESGGVQLNILVHELKGEGEGQPCRWRPAGTKWFQGLRVSGARRR